MRGRLLPMALALAWLATAFAAAPAAAQQVVDKYQEFMANNPAVAEAKIQEVMDIVRFLESYGIPAYRWDCQSQYVDVEEVTLGTPSCSQCTGGPGPVVMISLGYDLEPGFMKAFVFGVLSGDINFIGTYDNGSLHEYPDVTGNVFAGAITEGSGYCYAQTSLALWSHETRNEYLVPQGGSGPYINCDNVFFVLASDFKGAPDGVFRQFMDKFNYLTQL